MKKALLSLLFISILYFLNAQDTTVVQTLTWADDFRAGVFEFPDNPPGDWEKVLMMYNMRCHDTAVGSGTVGCREWDYSCNTFITDSSRVDSTRLTHLTYIISNFDNTAGNTFRYSEQPVYTYTQYDQHVTDYTNTISETEGVIGTNDLNIAFTGRNSVNRNQHIFRASELQAAGIIAGNITGLKLDFVEAGDKVGFVRIRMKETSDTEMEPTILNSNGFTEVYFNDTEIPDAGNHFFKFYENFEWDGTSNIIVDFSFTTQPVANQLLIAGHIAGFRSGKEYASAEDHAITFKGAGSIRTPDLALTEISDEITIALWTKGNEEALPTGTFAFEGDNADGEREAGVHLPWGNGQIFWDCGNEGTYDRISKQATESEYEGTWTHWTFTKNATAGSMKIFKNGELWHQAGGKTNLIDIQKFVIGANGDGGTSYHGQIDDLHIFNKELDGEEIKRWMFYSNGNSWQSLQSSYKFDEGSGRITKDNTPNEYEANFEGFPEWSRIRGKDLFKGFALSEVRPTTTFVQGEYEITDQVVTVLDSVQNAPNMVVSYGLNGTDLMTIDTQFVWDADASLIYDEAGNLVSFNDVMLDGSVMLEEFDYYQKRPAKYEILSLVTPYGNGLDLGQEGKTFKIDVTDYAPILRGEKRMSLEMGGQNQEEMDIKFLFIKGTPAREVIDVQNIWPFRRGNIGDILNDRWFEPRMVAADNKDYQYKLRIAVTGHGQNGEFQSRNHYVTAGSEKFNFDVWKECSDIPIYPQGGTWPFDRAGWCPGAPTDIHEFDITKLVQQGQPIQIDYGINGATMAEANYLVSAQLVTYGKDAFEVDAALEEIIRPSDQLEFERLNPACNGPMVRIKNNGQKPLTNATIEYGEVDGEKKKYNWTGSLEFSEMEDIALPIQYLGYWNGLEGAGTFEASLSNVNGGLDEYENNDRISTTFNRPKVFERPIQVKVRTNNRGNETSYTVKDTEGNTILERNNLASNTLYTDQLQLPRGCYTFEINDSADDGLYYWFWEAQPNPADHRGRGSARLMQVYSNGIALAAHTFEPEFGRSAQIDFAIPAFVNTLEQGEIEFFSLYPNPASESINLDLKGFDGDEFQIEIVDIHGKVIKVQKTSIFNKEHLETIDISTLPAGMYFAKVKNSDRFWVEEFVKN